MQYALSYNSQRSDVWRWYWRTWRKKLWPLHVALSVGVAWLVAQSTSQPLVSVEALAVAGGSLIAIVGLSSALSQAMFKSATRKLVVDVNGWSTVVGNKTGSRSWAEVESLSEEANHVVLTGKDWNALLIPKSAFDSDEHMRRFIESVREWKGHAS
jgi:hypothetical protein